MVCHIDVRFFPAPADLAGCFSTVYCASFSLDGQDMVSDLLQPEWANLRFFKGGTPIAGLPGKTQLRDARFAATGPSSAPVEFELPSTRMWGVGLFPLGWAKFCSAHAADLANCVVDGEQHPAFANFRDLAETVFDDDDNLEREHEAILTHFRKLDRKVPDGDRITTVHKAMVDESVGSVMEFAEHAGLGRRTLERLCYRYFGFPPKLLLRRQRFMRSLAQFMLDGTPKWSDAIDEHYHDQPQFVREFRSFMGMSPRNYAAREHPILRAFMHERAKIWGAAVQTLDQPGGRKF